MHASMYMHMHACLQDILFICKELWCATGTPTFVLRTFLNRRIIFSIHVPLCVTLENTYVRAWIYTCMHVYTHACMPIGYSFHLQRAMMCDRSVGILPQQVKTIHSTLVPAIMYACMYICACVRCYVYVRRSDLHIICHIIRHNYTYIHTYARVYDAMYTYADLRTYIHQGCSIFIKVALQICEHPAEAGQNDLQYLDAYNHVCMYVRICAPAYDAIYSYADLCAPCRSLDACDSA
jgi:hypothetical protein